MTYEIDKAVSDVYGAGVLRAGSVAAQPPDAPNPQDLGQWHRGTVSDDRRQSVMT